ncbi:MAG: hypothetical protein KatS3mg060_0166 [Dehalococcoidia bacterium]|nr:MAG: hypothetical protein KatS3mg060_0166 [Dehalococcoidia bacterium]
MAIEPAVEQRLVDEARAARHASYSPYSGFAVGAAVLGTSGRIFRGTNVENASYGLTICAERAAVFSAVSAGERAIEAVAIVTPAPPATPCGACRQVLWELWSPHRRSEPTVLIASVESSQPDRRSLASLLPDAFDATSLGEPPH